MRTFIKLLLISIIVVCECTLAEESLNALLNSVAQSDAKIKSLEISFSVKILPLKGKSESNTYATKGSDIGEFIWYMKGHKLRLDEIDGQTKQAKIRGIYDGEKHYIYFYEEDIPKPKESGAVASELKRGTIAQVQINTINMPTLDKYLGRMDIPLAYFGLGIDFGMEQGSKILSEALKESHVEYLGKEIIDGVACYVLQLRREEEVPTISGGKHIFKDKKKLWIDPAIGYKIRQRVDYLPDADEERTLIRYKDFKQYGEDIWIPQRVEVSYYSIGKEKTKSNLFVAMVLEVKECEVNWEIPDSFFSLQLPEGTPVWDQQTDRFYKWGEKQPTDEDILKLANVAREFIEGKASLELLGGYENKGVTEAFNCGPNALLAVCEILGVKTSSQEIAKLAGTDEKGNTSMAGLKRAAEALGLKVEAMDLTLDELRQTKKLAIAWLPPGHYIVVVGFADDKVVIIDPPTVLAAVPISGLDNLWDGRVLLISKP